MLVAVKGTDTSRGPNPIPIHAPIDHALKVLSAHIVMGAQDPFMNWQDVAWYFMVDSKASALFQNPGANLDGMTILVELQ